MQIDTRIGSCGHRRMGNTSGRLPRCLRFRGLRTPEKAFDGIRSLAVEAVADMEALGEAAPAPIASRAYSGKFQVRIPPELHRRLAMEAAEERVSLNRLVAARLA